MSGRASRTLKAVAKVGAARLRRAMRGRASRDRGVRFADVKGGGKGWRNNLCRKFKQFLADASTTIINRLKKEVFMYVLINNGIVSEIIPEESPDFPGVPVSARYEASFVKKLMRVSDGAEVAQGWTWDAESGTFGSPREPLFLKEVSDEESGV